MANKQTGGTRLTGQGSLNYLGVEPVSPPNLVRYQRQPTSRDFNFNLGDLWMVEDPTEVWMLADKPQNVADWILIYPQAGGGGIAIIVTPQGDVVANPDSEVNFNDGENTNCEKIDNNTLTFNLNRFIIWPNTNSAGNEGIIYLGGNTFLHNYGEFGSTSANTFLGQSAGNLTTTGVGANTAVGYNALNAIEAGTNNTALGTDALSNTVNGNNNLALGSEAGSGLNTFDSNNILIDHLGFIGDSGGIRIGTEGRHTYAFLAGVTGVTVTTPPTSKKVVNISTDGQLGEVELTSSDASIFINQSSNGVIDFVTTGGGSGNAFAFNYIHATDLTFATLDTNYLMGSQEILTKLFDDGNNVFPGTGLGGAGSEAYFQAPITGKYFLQISADWTSTGLGIVDLRSRIITPARTYTFENAAPAGTNFANNQIVADLTMGDQVTFEFGPLNGDGVSLNTIYGNNNPAFRQNKTSICGFLLTAGGGGAFSQPFLGIQQVNAVNAVGTFASYYLGSQAIMDDTAPGYDIGNNFFPGDGAGTGATFTAQETGIYSFTMSARMSGLSDLFSAGVFAIEVNGVIVQTSSIQGSNSSGGTIGGGEFTFNFSLTAADVVRFIINTGNTGGPRNLLASVAATGISPAQTNITFVSGYRIA